MVRNLLVCVLFLFVTGCSVRRGMPLGEPVSPEDGASWHQVRTYFSWPAGEEINFIDPMIVAHRVFKPVLAQSAREIYLWRFHQRALRDAGGKQITFFIFTTPKHFSAIENEVRENTILQQMMADGVIQRLESGVVQVSNPHMLAGISDEKWPEQLQDAWPLYANGASAAWLALVDSFAAERCADDAPYSALKGCFQKVAADVDVNWRMHGQHAFFHHLSAIFGYRPVYMRKDLVF